MSMEWFAVGNSTPVPPSGSSSSGNCDITDPLAGSIIMALLGLGTTISYLPTVYEIIAARSSKGISIGSAFLMNVTNWFNTLGILLVNWDAVLCCRDGYDNAGQCFQGINPVWLMGSNILGCLPLYVATLIFFTPPGTPENRKLIGDAERIPNDDDDTNSDQSVASHTSFISQNLLDTPELAGFTTKFGAWMSLLVFVLVCAAGSVAGAILLVVYKDGSTAVDRYADAVNLFAAITMGLTWLPQMIHTYRIKQTGSLSIVTLLMQAPGAAAVCVSLITADQPISTIAPNTVACICLSILLFLSVKYTYCTGAKKDMRALSPAPELPSDDDAWAAKEVNGRNAK